MIVVTAATGRIGNETARLLAARGEQVRAVVRDPAKAEDLRAAGVEVVQGDQTDRASLEAAFAGASAVLLNSSNDLGQEEREGNTIDAAKDAGVRHVVKVSALGATEDSPVSILRTHAVVERRLKGSGLSWTILQPSYFFQNFFIYAGTIAPQGAFYGAMGDAPIGWIDTRDIAAVAVEALLEPAVHEGKTYVLTGPEAFSYPDAARRLSAATGREISYVDLPPEAARQGMVDAGLPEWLADDLTALGELFKGPIGPTVDPAVRQVTGRDARSFDEFARDYAGMFAPAG